MREDLDIEVGVADRREGRGPGCVSCGGYREDGRDEGEVPRGLHGVEGEEEVGFFGAKNGGEGFGREAGGEERRQALAEHCEGGFDIF